MKKTLASKTLRNALAAAAALPLLAAPAFAAGGKTFSIAVIPDTQNYVDYTHQKVTGFPFDAEALFLQQMQYIADHTIPRGGDIAFVSGLGDVWQHQSLAIDPAHAARGFKRAPNPFMDQAFPPTTKVREIEMPSARKGYQMIAGLAPFAVVPGNHDGDAMWTDSNHPPSATFHSLADLGVLHSAGHENFDTVFGDQSEFFKGKKWYVASHDGGADSAQIFTAGGYRFLHIGLQFDPPNDTLAWAAEIIKRYPGMPTIVTTHDYLDTDGQRLPNPLIDNHAVDLEDNTPQMVWDKFLSQHDQIFLVLCGHEHGQAFRVDDNIAGHKVYQILSDYQDRDQTVIDAGGKPSQLNAVGDGWFRLMKFDMSGKAPRVTVKTYSTHYGRFSREEPNYAAWYKAQEKPKMTDADYLDQDDYTFDLADFRARFGKGSAK